MSKWTPERLKKDRESWEAKNNSRTTNRTASTGTAAGTANTTDKWTPERIAKARESWEAKSSGQNAASPAAAARQNTGTGLGARVLAQMTGADSGHKLQLAVPQETGRTQAYPGKSGIVTDSGTGTRSSTAQPEWLNAKSTAAPAAKVTGTVQPTERQRIAGIASGDEGWYAQTAQKVKQYTEDLKATDDFSDFDRLNQWMDADPKHRELVTLMRIGTGGQSYAEKNNAMQPQSVSGAAASAAVPERVRADGTTPMRNCWQRDTAARRSAKRGSTLPTLMRCLQDSVQRGARPIPLAVLETRWHPRFFWRVRPAYRAQRMQQRPAATGSSCSRMYRATTGSRSCCA